MEKLGHIFPGESEMARRMRAFDWTQTPLGSPDLWPSTLRTGIRIILTARQPMFIWWGERLINLYNDGYAEFLHGRHPWALGQPAAEVWPEIWPEIGPRAQFARCQESGTYDEALPLIVRRKGYPEETYVTFSYNPIPDDSGRVGGILCPVTEETHRVVGERQLAVLRQLSVRTADARNPEEACQLAASALATNPKDLPFALIYMREGKSRELTLAAWSGVAAGNEAAPRRLDLETRSTWQILDALDAPHGRSIVNVTRIADILPRARGTFQLKYAAVLPLLLGSEQSHIGGLLIVGLNPLRRYDDGYGQFLELVASTLSTAISNAQAYDAERRRGEMLAELDRAKTEFFSNVSHEFRTPLTLMLGLLEDELQQPGAHDRLNLVRRNALRLLKLVNTLLDFSRIEAGRMGITYARTNLAAVTSDLGSVFRSAIEKAGLRFHVDCPSLPEPVYVDRAMWEQIVLNLLSNAFKFTYEGEIAMRLRPGPGHVELLVSDTGCGISQAHLPHIFERFYRIQHTRSRTYEGSGIGLALVAKLVQLHGGRISVDSAVDRGTTFTVSIPSGTAHIPAEQLVSAQSTAEASRLRRSAFIDEAELWLANNPARPALEDIPSPHWIRPMSRSRILIADDNADLRLYLGSLVGHDHDVTVVDDGEAALAAIREHPPDLVVADVMMPRLDGHELIMRVRADPLTAGIPVILLSARVDEDARIEGLRHGADDYLLKPFSARELKARINTQLALSSARRSVERILRQSNRELVRKVEDRSAELRDGEERKAYLLTLSDALRPLRDPVAIQQEATRLLRDKLEAGWCYYAEFESTGTAVTVLRSSTRLGLPPLVEQTSHLPAEHVSELRAGRMVVVSDIFGAESLHGVTIKYYVSAGVRALLGVPLVKDGALIAVLIVADAMVRPWTDTAINLISETAERTWAAVERARAEAHQSVLLAELQHRVRNIMALIRSVTLRTGQRARSVAEYSELLSGRLLALARVQALLTRAANRWINIADIVKDEVSGHDDQFQTTGPDVTVSPKATEVITLVLHELVTNAVKYGALSLANGRVQINWATFDHGGAHWLGLDWIESGGPALPPPGAEPRHRGFGSELIEELIPYELGGKGHLTLTPQGARCRLEFPVEDGTSILETDAPQKSIMFGNPAHVTSAHRMSA